MAEVTIRAYEQRDEQAVVALWKETGLSVSWNDPVQDIRRKLADSPELFFVAEAQGEVVGTCMAGYDGHRGGIFYMGVHPETQGRGVARALLAHAEAVLKGLGCSKINLMVRDSNTQVHDFYRHLGYADDPVKVFGKRLIADE